MLNNGVINIATNRTIISPTLLDNKNCIAFNILSYILLPSSTAETIVAKLSSVSITSAASFATSVPTIPIAQPISAVFSAGASLTPSPVIATISPFACHAFTILTLCSGDTLAYTLYFLIFFVNSSSVISSNSLPVNASLSFSNIPKAFAIAIAVILWSPVIITVFIPAVLHLCTASFTSSLGGSIIPTIPIYIKSFSKLAMSSSVGSWFNSLYPIAKTLKAFLAISSLFSDIVFLYSSKFVLISSFNIYFVHLFNNSSTPPLVQTTYFSPTLFTVVINFLSESNGISFNLGICSNNEGSKSNLNPISTSAVSVGSPVSWLSVLIFVSLHNILVCTNLFNVSSSCFKSILFMSNNLLL